ncbi:MAG TPA: FtsQ-type POTRA domain-containing protein [Vicinamibacteria bacterium]
MSARRGLPTEPFPDLIDLPLGNNEEPPFFRPRHRTQVRKARRATLSSRAALMLQLVGAVLALGAFAWAGYARVMASEGLKVAKVEVRGGHFLSEGEVRELLGPAVGENILSMDIEALKARLRASPWVAEATVSRTLPDTLKVSIRERVPVALAEIDRLYLMDAEGGLIDIFGPRTAAFDLPIVRGLQGLHGDARRDRAERAGALLHDLGDLGAEISEVYVLGTGDLKVILRGAGETLLLGPPPCRPRFLAFLGLRRELAEKAPGTESFDLRFRGRIYARPAPGPTPGPAASPLPASTPKTALEVPAAPQAVAPLPGPASRGLPRVSDDSFRRN